MILLVMCLLMILYIALLYNKNKENHNEEINERIENNQRGFDYTPIREK